MAPDVLPRAEREPAGAQPFLVFAADAGGAGEGIELRVNFGLFAGREVTPAEIDDLGRLLVARVHSLTIVAERSHEIGHTAQAVLHQVVVRVAPEELAAAAADRAELRGRLLEVTERWAHACIAERYDPVGEDVQELMP